MNLELVDIQIVSTHHFKKGTEGKNDDKRRDRKKESKEEEEEDMD